MTPLQRLLARVLALGAAYFSVSLLERMAASAEADAAAARLAAHAADAALFEHLTGDACACPEQPTPHVCQVCDYPLEGHGATC